MIPHSRAHVETDREAAIAGAIASVHKPQPSRAFPAPSVPRGHCAHYDMKSRCADVSPRIFNRKDLTR